MKRKKGMLFETLEVTLLHDMHEIKESKDKMRIPYKEKPKEHNLSKKCIIVLTKIEAQLLKFPWHFTVNFHNHLYALNEIKYA